MFNLPKKDERNYFIKHGVKRYFEYGQSPKEILAKRVKECLLNAIYWLVYDFLYPVIAGTLICFLLVYLIYAAIKLSQLY